MLQGSCSKLVVEPCAGVLQLQPKDTGPPPCLLPIDNVTLFCDLHIFIFCAVLGFIRWLANPVCSELRGTSDSQFGAWSSRCWTNERTEHETSSGLLRSSRAEGSLKGILSSSLFKKLVIRGKSMTKLESFQVLRYHYWTSGCLLVSAKPKKHISGL